MQEKIVSLEKQVSELTAALNNQQIESQSMLDEHTTVKPPASWSNGSVTLEQLQSIMPNLDDAKASEHLPYLNAAMAEAEINTPLRQAAFLAQLAQESGEFVWMEELDGGGDYEGRDDLGNVNQGDGRRYKGRGPFMLVGRYNYSLASQALGVDLVNNPERAADLDVAFRTAAWYWTSASSSGDLNLLADERRFDDITFGVNAGLTNIDEREAYYQRACEVLNAK